MGDVDRIAGLARSDALGSPGGDGDDAKERDADTEMRTAVPQADAASPPHAAAPRRAARRRTMVRSAISTSAPAITKDCKPDAERRQHRTAMLQREGGGDRDRRNDRRGDEALRGAEKIAAFPSEQRPNGMASNSGTNSGPKVALKNGGPTEIFSPVSASSASG